MSESLLFPIHEQVLDLPDFADMLRRHITECFAERGYTGGWTLRYLPGAVVGDIRLEERDMVALMATPKDAG